jgi:guanosine-3',5'-bis(diphosphate) 3'-pyrophosphohydrolase
MDSPVSAPNADRPSALRRGKHASSDTTLTGGAALARSALAFAVHAHAGQRRTSDDASFIEHPLEVARRLRDAGCSAELVAAGLLHEVLNGTPTSATELTTCFGAKVTDLIQAVSDDASEEYHQRTQAQRERVRAAGSDAALLFAADKIAHVRELPGQMSRDRARCVALPPNSHTCRRVERSHCLRLEHYRESLKMLQGVDSRHPLIRRLASELDACERTLARAAIWA